MAGAQEVRGDKAFEQAVEMEKFRLRVRAEAVRQVREDLTRQVEIPTGQLIDDPLPAAPTELVPGVLLADGATGIIGQKETGKSLVALEIQYSLLTGEPLWGALAPAGRLDTTIHFLAEHASTVLMGLYRRVGFAPTRRLRLFGPEDLGPMKLLVSRGRLREEAVRCYETIVQDAGAGLVVFDPLASFIQGDDAENDNASMRTLIDAMIGIARAARAACLILGHQGKPSYLSGGREARKPRYATRGASSAEDAMTAVHYLSHRTGETHNGQATYELRPVHFKGVKHKPFLLVRDRTTCRHTLLRRA